MIRWMIVATVFASVGCGMLPNLVPVETKEVDKANAYRDLATLDKICAGEVRLRYDRDKERACTYAARHRAVEGDCASLVERYESTTKDWKMQKTMGEQFATCEMYTEFFEQVVHWGNQDEGVRLLAHLDEAGHPMEEKFAAYAQSHQGASFMNIGENEAKFALDYIGKWLVAKGSTGHCDVVVEAARDAKEIAKVWVMPYLKKSGCAAGAEIATDLLLSDSAQHRVWACQALGEIGAAKHLKAIHTMAENDGFSQVREEQRDGRIWAVKEWPVRDACRAAYGKVDLRASTASK